MCRQIPPDSTRRSIAVIDPSGDDLLLRRIEKRGSHREGLLSSTSYDDLSRIVGLESRVGQMFEVEVDGIELTALADALALEGESTGSAGAAVGRLIDYAMSGILLCGKSHIEIAYHNFEQKGNRSPGSFSLHRVPPGSVGRRWGRPVQWVPADVGEARDMKGVSFISLDPAQLITMSLPRKLGRPLAKMLRFIRSVDRTQAEDMRLMESSLAGRATYSFEERRELVGDALARATRSVGWNARGLYTKNRLDPTYLTWRNLQFLEYRVACIATLSSQIEHNLVHIGKQVGFSVSLRSPGVRTVEDVRKLKEDFASGRVPVRSLITASVRRDTEGEEDTD